MKTFLGPTVSKVETEKKGRQRNHEDTDRGLPGADAAARGGGGGGLGGARSSVGARGCLWCRGDRGVHRG